MPLWMVPNYLEKGRFHHRQERIRVGLGVKIGLGENGNDMISRHLGATLRSCTDTGSLWRAEAGQKKLWARSNHVCCGRISTWPAGE